MKTARFVAAASCVISLVPSVTVFAAAPTASSTAPPSPTTPHPTVIVPATKPFLTYGPFTVGLETWFSIYFGNRLPELSLSVAYIAHSDEAILAFLAIVLWHFYNTHFNPDNFPMSKTWYTGTKTRSEMEREHPLELERLERQSPPEGITTS